MAQLCNVAFAYQVDTISSTEELEEFIDNLPVPPEGSPVERRRSRVSSNLLNLMAPPSMKA